MPATDYKDYYKILGVSKSADEGEIKKTFRRLARKYHPDMNPGDKTAEAKFKEVSEAYEVLSDPDKRKKYDQFGQYWQQASQGGFNTGGAGGVDFGQYGSFDEFINELLGRFGGFGGASPGGAGFNNYGQTSGFGGGFSDFAGYGAPNARASTPPADSESSIQLTFEEAMKGTEKTLVIGGSETVSVRIPAGAKNGTRIRIKGKGQRNPMTQARGDLYLKVQLKPHDFFSFEGDKLICELPITPDEAVLGATVQVPTPSGPVKMKIPAGVKSGQSLRLRKKGWPKKGGAGDQLVRLQIVSPTRLSSEEKDYYKKLASLRTFDPRAHMKGV